MQHHKTISNSMNIDIKELYLEKFDKITPHKNGVIYANLYCDSSGNLIKPADFKDQKAYQIPIKVDSKGKILDVNLRYVSSAKKNAMKHSLDLIVKNWNKD